MPGLTEDGGHIGFTAPSSGWAPESPGPPIMHNESHSLNTDRPALPNVLLLPVWVFLEF